MRTSQTLLRFAQRLCAETRLRCAASCVFPLPAFPDPSPCPEAVDFLCFPQSHARQCSTVLLARAARSRKSTASVQGEGKRAWRARVRAVSTQSLTCILIARSARCAHVRRASLSSPQRGSLRKQRHKRDSLARPAFGFASATPHWK